MHTMKTNRRSTFKKFALGIAGLLGFSVAKAASADSEKVVTGEIYQDGQTQLFSSSVKHGGLVYVSGNGADFDGNETGDIRQVLDEIEEEFKKAGSLVERVLKLYVHLHELAYYKAMDEAYRGRFGKNPP